jgi:hypothetical protein
MFSGRWRGLAARWGPKRTIIDLCVGKGTLYRSGILNLGAKRSIINPRINNKLEIG